MRGNTDAHRERLSRWIVGLWRFPRQNGDATRAAHNGAENTRGRSADSLRLALWEEWSTDGPRADTGILVDFARFTVV